MDHQDDLLSLGLASREHVGHRFVLRQLSQLELALYIISSNHACHSREIPKIKIKKTVVQRLEGRQGDSFCHALNPPEFS